MSRDLEIKGGAGEFEAAVIAVVIDKIAREEAAARQGRGKPTSSLPAWILAIQPGEPQTPREIVHPD